MKEKFTRQETGFAQVKNEVLSSTAITWKAKGLYAYLYSKPNDWDFSADRICLEGIGDRKTILSGLKELEDYGVLERIRLGNGRVEYHLSILPKVPKPDCGEEDPKSENGTVAFGHGGKNGLVSNKDSIQIKNLEITKKASPLFDVEPSEKYPNCFLVYRTSDGLRVAEFFESEDAEVNRASAELYVKEQTEIVLALSAEDEEDEIELTPPPRQEAPKKTPRAFANQRRAELGKPPLQPKPMSQKQLDTIGALKLADYYKAKAQEFHGLTFLAHNEDRKQIESVNGKIRKQMLAFFRRCDYDMTKAQNVIDWYLDLEGEWCNYDPAQCFKVDIVAKFENKDVNTKKGGGIYE